MKKYILIGLFLIYANLGFSQPGYFEKDDNLNNFSDSSISHCEKSPEFFRCTFRIDSTTDLKRIKLLDSFTSLSLFIDLPQMPKEFYNLKFDTLSRLGIHFSPKFISLKGFSSISLKKLTYLSLSFDSEIENLESLGNLSNLQRLYINCTSKELDFKSSSFPSLTEFSINTPNLQNIDVLAKMKTLKSITISALNLQNIDVLTKIKNLKSITIICKNLKTIPRFKANNTIESFSLTDGYNLIDYNNLKTLQQLEVFTITNGNMMQFPSNFGKKLKRISLYGLPNLSNISEITNCHNLASLFISKTGLKELKCNFSNLTQLKAFSINHNDSLKSIEGINSMRSLDKIEISNLPSLYAIDFDLSKSKFKSIYLSDLNNLTNINGILSCHSLESLSIDRTGLKTIPENFSELENLKGLSILHNNELYDISGIKNMKSLDGINIYECNKLTEIPLSFSSNKSLHSVRLEFMKQLKFSQGLAKLENLNSLYIRALNDDFSLADNLEESKNIEKITIESHIKNVSMIKNLKNLKAICLMYSLSKLPLSIYTNSNLEKFELYVSSISDLTSLTQFKKLKELHLRQNQFLTKIPNLTDFESLSIVEIRDNEKLKISESYEDNWEINDNAN